jgi:hypothetical protein
MLQIAFSFSFLFLPLMGSEFEKKKTAFTFFRLLSIPKEANKKRLMKKEETT